MARAGYGERLRARGVGYQGNAGEDGDEYRGWLPGHFIVPDAHGIPAVLRQSPGCAVVSILVSFIAAHRRSWMSTRGPAAGVPNSCG